MGNPIAQSWGGFVYGGGGGGGGTYKTLYTISGRMNADIL